MKITTKITLEYLKKNKRRSIVTIIRNNGSNNTCHNTTYIIFELSRIYGK